ncbi:c-type cytochrome [Legionella sp. D16C41]|uniref:c-type cytochrome n=1 Tax=Legionella sp. D16C41 TaxID=3402688 RepID=UPI003AF818F8
MQKIIGFLSLTLLIIVLPTFAADKLSVPVNLTININEKAISLAELKKRIKPVRVVIYNPTYKAEKAYYVFPLKEILSELLNVDFSKNIANQLLLVETKDRYLGKIPLSYFNSKDNAYLAYSEDPKNIAPALKTPDGNWSYLFAHQEKIHPGPFYIVWDTTKTYPVGWPFQVISLKIADQKQFIVDFLSPDSDAKSLKHGHDLFQNVCSSCHSLYYHGNIGRAPDLGMVTNYLTVTDIAKIITHGRGYMPAIGSHFSEQDIKDTISYLSWVSKKGPSLHNTLKP